MINIEKYIVKVCSGTGEGSGFLLDGGYIVTANHNIRDGQTAFFILNELTNKFDQKLEIDNPGFVPIRKAKEEGDFAVFRLKYGEKLRHRTLSLLPEHKSTGKEFMCYGFPKDEAPTGRAYNNGKIDAIEQPHVYSYPRMNLLNTNEGVIKPGFSGSPIIDPIQRAVVGIILMEKDGVDVIGVGGAWIKQHLKGLPIVNGTVNRFFDKKIPNLDLHLFSCNREDQLDELKAYFDTQHRSLTHQHIFLFADTKDKPDSLVTRFLKELQSRKNVPKLDVSSKRYEDLFDYVEAQPFPESEQDLLAKDWGERLKSNNEQQDYIVFFWKLPDKIWKKDAQIRLLEGLLQGELLKKYASRHRLMMVYWLNPKKDTPSKNLLFWQKHICQNSARVKILLKKMTTKYCLLESLNDINERHLEDWFDQFCRNIARASDTYLSWLKDHQQLKMAVVEKELQDLIIQHNPDYQHLRS